MKGRIALAKGRTAVLGYLAAVAAGEKGTQKASASWLERNGFELGDRGVRDVTETRLKRLGAPSPADGVPDAEGWVRESIDFDAVKLDLHLVVAVFPASEHPDRLVEALRSSRRVVKIYRGYDGELVAIIVYDGAKELRDLHATLVEREPEMRWTVIRDVDDTPAASTWLSLAERAAEEEGIKIR